MPRTRYTEEQVLEAIRGSLGIVSHIAGRLQCEWHTARIYIDQWTRTRQAYADENERALDLSESKMLEAIQAGDGAMIRFHLATKGKARGYAEKLELNGAGEVLLRVVYGEEGALGWDNDPAGPTP